MDGNQPQSDEDFLKAPVEERLLSKVGQGCMLIDMLQGVSLTDTSIQNWKARVSAYSELSSTFAKTIQEDAPEFIPYHRDPSILRNAILDSNAVAQEQGIQCCLTYLEYAGSKAASSSKEAFCSALIEKNILGSTRAGTKKAAIELCLILVECDNNADTVFEACIDGLKSKQPKAVAGAVTVMKEIVKQFGAKTVNVKPILKTIPIIFAHPDKTVRAEGTSLVQELHRWLGAALDPHLAELKPVQQKELTESFGSEEKPEQTRYTRAQQRERALKEAEASLTANDAANQDTGGTLVSAVKEEEDEPVDAFDFAEPQAILSKLPSGFYDNLASAKWKDRKELALDPLLNVLKLAPKIQDANYDELVRALAGRMTDANIACVISAAGCIECLAKGLRTDFAKYKTTALPPILERCKEKKQSVTDALASALDAIFASVTISDLVEDISAFAKHKNPQVKEQTYKFLVRSLSTTRVAPSLKTDLKPLSDALLSGMDDSFGPVRDAAAEGLGTLNKIVGDRAMTAILDNLDDIKKKKVQEFAAKAEVRCKGLPTAAPPAKTTAVPANRPVTSRPKPSPVPQSPAGSDKENDGPSVNKPSASAPKPASQTKPPIRKPPVLSSTKKPAVPAVVAISSTGKSAALRPKPSASEPVKYKYTQEDAEAQAESVLPTEILADLANSVWKLRLAAMDSLQAWVAGDGQTAEAELIVRSLSKKPGWKESNFQVYAKMAELFATMAHTSPSWTRACSALTIGPLSDKLGDIKLKKSTGDALIAYAEKFSLQFVLSLAYDSMTKQKAPKAQADSLLWIEQSLRDFGVQGVAVRELIEFLKTTLKSSNAAVRTSATKTLTTLRIFVGPDIKTFIQDLNPTLLTTIEQEFDKVNGEQAPAPTRLSGDNAQAASSVTSGSGKANAGGGDALDDLFPRQDITKLIPPSIIKAISDANWKQRKESLEHIQGVLEANKRLKPVLGDLGNALKMRLPDSNKVVQGLALDVIARLASGMNSPFEKFARLFVSPTCGILADAKANVRAPALAALTSIASECGLDCMISQVAVGLEPANPIQRSELASWLVARLAENSSVDLSPIISPVLMCLEDKSGDVRKATQALLPYLITSVSYETLLGRANSLKPASRSMIIPMLDNARAASAGITGKAPGASSTSSKSAPANHGTSTLPSDATANKPQARGLPAVTRNLKPAASSASSRSATPTSRPESTASLAAPGSARKATVSGRPFGQSPVKASAINTMAKAIPQNTPPFLTSDPNSKQIRASRETGPLKWHIDGTARSDQVDYLQQQFLPHASQELVLMLFSRDHHSERDYAAGMAMLIEAANAKTFATREYDIDFSEMQGRLLANADLILKYLSIRLGDTSTTIALKCLDVTEAIVHVMLDNSYHLSDYEAGALLPGIISRMGDSKDAIRTRVKAVVRSLGSIYPSSKVFAALLEYGSRSKNARVRAESIGELGNLLQRQGMGVCQPGRALPELAALISDRDAASRSAALDAITQAYAQVGEDVFKYITNLQPKEQSMLDERLKRSQVGESSGTPKRAHSRQSMSRPESRVETSRLGASSRLPGPASALRRQSALPGPSDQASRRMSQLPQTIQPVHSPEQAFTNLSIERMVTDERAPQHRARSASIEAHGPFASITSHNTSQSVDALKVIQRRIAEDTQALIEQADALMEALTAQMAFAFQGLDKGTSQETLRLCKHLMQTLSSFFDQKALSLAVSKASLIKLLGELTKRLLETADSGASEAIVSLSKVLNMVLIRIFHNSDNSSCFGSLFKILEHVTLDLRDVQGEELASRSKYAELVMKCLWKISKSVKDNLEDGSLDAKKLLLDIDQFLQAIPPAEWRRRASDNIPLGDMPLRTVKTILQQVVGTFGDSVYDQLSLLERPENSFVYQYLYRLLNNSRSVVATEATGSSGQLSRQSSTMSHAGPAKAGVGTNGSTGSVGDAASPNLNIAGGAPMSPGRSSDIEMNLALKDIFDKIGNAQESKKGIAELYEFRKLHPEADARINTWITATGSFFQSYLKRALSNLAAEEADRNASGVPGSPPSSRPMSVFPSAPSSPKVDGNLHLDYTEASKSPSSRLAKTASRVTSGTANDPRLDSLKQMFGVRETR